MSKFKPDNFEKRIQKIPVELIQIADYQRVLRDSIVNKIVKEFEPVGLGNLLVSFRDGRYWVFDGQHRLSALKIMGVKTAECIVYTGMTYYDEAKAWDYFNTTKKATKLDKANSEFLRGEPLAVAINQAVEECGLMIDYKAANRDGAIRAYSAIESIYKKYGKARLQKTLRFLKETFGLSNSVYRRSVLIGTTEFFVRYENNPKFNQKFLEKQLVKNGIDVLNNLATRNKQQYNQTLDEAVVSALIELYNKGKKYENRLS